MALQKGSAVYIMGTHRLGPCIAKYLGEEGDTAFVEVLVRFSYGEVLYDLDVPKNVLCELPQIELDW